MNFLAHAYLSFNQAPVLIGNMISDFVKGKSRYAFPLDVQVGIELHRNIDSFTDAHASTKEAQAVFKPVYHLYSGPITDVLFDHFLANDAAVFDEAKLKDFSTHVYEVLLAGQELLPPRFASLLVYMRTENWLYSYRNKAYMQNSLNGLVRRSKFLQESEIAYQLFLTHYNTLRHCFSSLFPDVAQFAHQRLHELTNSPG